MTRAFSTADFPGASCRCRQPEQSSAARHLTDLLPEPVELSALLAAAIALVFGAGLTAIDARLPDPASEAAGGQAKALGTGMAGEGL